MATQNITPGRTPHGLVTDSSLTRSTAFVIQCVSGDPLHYSDAANVAGAQAAFHVLGGAEQVQVQTPATGDIFIWSPNASDAKVTVTEAF